MPDSKRELRFRFETPRLGRRTKATPQSRTGIRPALPRITRLMALAIKVDGLSRECPDLDGIELARRAQVSRTRITQILNLLCLAPDIQERLLFLPPLCKGREVISEKSLRRLTGDYDWERQREQFAQLLARRPGGLFHIDRAIEERSIAAANRKNAAKPVKEHTTMTSNHTFSRNGGPHV